MLTKFETSRTFPSYYPGMGGGGGWVRIIRIKAISVQSIEIELGLTGTELGNKMSAVRSADNSNVTAA